MSDSNRGRRLVRLKAARSRLGVGKTKFKEKFVKTGRLRLVPLGKHSLAVDEEQLDAVIGEVIAEGEASAPIDRSLQVRDSASGKFVKSRKSTKEIHP